MDSCGVEVAVCVTVTVGIGDAEGVADGVAPLVGSLVGAVEVGAGVTTVTDTTLNSADDEPGKAPGQTGETESIDCEGIHYRPQLMRTAMRTTAAVGRPRTTDTSRAGFFGTSTGFSKNEDIR